MLHPLDTADVFALSSTRCISEDLSFSDYQESERQGGVDSGEVDEKYTEAELCRLTLVSEGLMKFYEVTG